LLPIAVTPECGGVAIAPEFGGDFEVGGMIGGGGSQDQATPKDQGLRSGSGAHQSFEPSSLRIGQSDDFCERCWHEMTSVSVFEG